MKLPKIEYRAVESLGRSDSGAVAQAASVAGRTGQLQQQMANVIASAADKYVERKQNAEYNDQVASMQTEMNDWQGRYSAKDFFTADELGEIGTDLVPRIDTGTDGQGAQLTKVRDDIPAHEVYPLMLKQKLEALTRDKAAKISNPHMRKEFLNKASISNSQMLMTAAVNAENQQEAYLLKEGVYNAEVAAAGGNLDEALFYIDNLEAPETYKAELRVKAHHDDEMHDVVQAIRSSNQEVVKVWQSRLEDPNYDGNLSEPERKAAANDLVQRMDQLDAEKVAARKHDHAVMIDSLTVGIMDGEVSRVVIDSLYDSGTGDPLDPNTMTPQEHSSLVGQLRAYQRGIKVEAEYSAIVNGWLSGEIPADPSNAEHKKAMNWYVAQVGLTPENERELGVLAKNTGIIPDTLKVKVNGYVLNGSPEQAELGLRFFDNLESEAPHLVSQFSDDTKKVSRLATMFTDGGTPASEAITLARTYLTEVTPDSEAFYNTKLRLLEVDSAVVLKDIMDDDPMFEGGAISFSMGGSRVDPHPDMVFHFEQMTQHHYALTKGNYEQAATLAYKALQEEWGITEVGLSRSGKAGDRAARWPPESILQASSEQVNLALDDFAVDQGIDAGSVILIGDRNTAKNRTWNVVVFDEDTDTFSVHKKPFEGQKWLKSALDKDWDKNMETEKYKIRAREMVDQNANPTAGAIVP